MSLKSWFNENILHKPYKIEDPYWDQEIEITAAIEEIHKKQQEKLDQIKAVDWENLTKETIEELNKFENLRIYNPYINWYQISKFRGLPDDFIMKYYELIDWKIYDKSYLKTKTKNKLKELGYIK